MSHVVTRNTKMNQLYEFLVTVGVNESVSHQIKLLTMTRYYLITQKVKYQSIKYWIFTLPEFVDTRVTTSGSIFRCTKTTFS